MLVRQPCLHLLKFDFLKNIEYLQIKLSNCALPFFSANSHYNFRTRKRQTPDSPYKYRDNKKRQCGSQDFRKTTRSHVFKTQDFSDDIESEPSKSKPNASDKHFSTSEENDSKMDTNPDDGSFIAVVQNKTPDSLNLKNQNQTGRANTRSATKVSKQETQISGTKSLKTFQRSPFEDDIEVTFEVLLSQEMTFPNGIVQIVFGPPLSDWKTLTIEMRVKEGSALLMPGKYTPLIGVLYLPRDCQSKNIPYKYIVRKQYGFKHWEHIRIDDDEEKIVNRCLLVPSNIQNRFTKFDDVILADRRFRGFYDLSTLQRLGREAATNWMLPHPDEIENPEFDFSAALERFQLVVKSHKLNGTILCLGDNPKLKFNPPGYNVNDQVKIYLDSFLNFFDTYLRQSDSAKLLRATLSLLLLFDQTEEEMTSQFCSKIFEAFYTCQEALFYPSEQVAFKLICFIG